MTTRSSGFIALIKSIRRNFQFPLCEIEIKHKTHFFFPNSIWLLKEQLKVLIDIFLWSFLYPVLAGWCQVCVSVRHPSFPLLSPPAPVCVAELTTDTTDLLSHRSSGGVTEAAPLRGCTVTLWDYKTVTIMLSSQYKIIQFSSLFSDNQNYQTVLFQF